MRENEDSRRTRQGEVEEKDAEKDICRGIERYVCSRNDD